MIREASSIGIKLSGRSLRATYIEEAKRKAMALQCFINVSSGAKYSRL
ncbi:MAG: hypothetical protein QXM87_08975 [Candidatus Bathyarchaeia archaeon]